MKPVRKIGYFAPRFTVSVQRLLHRLYSFAARNGVELYHIELPKLPNLPKLKEGTDLALCLGGDGTMLSLVRQTANAGVLLAGVNTGHLGFLSSSTKEQFETFLQCLVDGSYEVEERAILEVVKQDVNGQDISALHHALNEVSLMRVQTGKMVDVDVQVDGQSFNRYHADGILVATPTGSSAYSLSAGGPLIWPNADVLCLTPICPHSLTNRAVVMPNSVSIKLRPHARRGRVEDQMIFSLDGRTTHPISLQETLLIRKADHTVHLVSLPNGGYASRLRSKLGW